MFPCVRKSVKKNVEGRSSVLRQRLLLFRGSNIVQTKIQIVKKENVANELKKGWRLTIRPVEGGEMFKEMKRILISKEISMVGLAEESSIIV